MFKRTLALTFILSALTATSYGASETIILTTYYEYPPWTNYGAPKSGLHQVLTEQLNRLGKGRYNFDAQVLPRKRIDQMLADQKIVLVAWVNPRFFNDSENVKYLWSNKLAIDKSFFISNQSRPFEFVNSSSFKNKHFSATLGHEYADMTDEIKSGQLIREDAPSLLASYEKLFSEKRNLDFAVIDRSTLAALKNDTRSVIKNYHISKKPRILNFTRFILIPKNRPDLQLFINESLKQLANEPNWKAELDKFQLK